MRIKNLYNHWKTIHTHRKWVKRYCFLAGIPWRGLTHDLSKYSSTEFFESARYWTGFSSPITEAKKAQGYSRAWLHHKGRNRHHWAYWTDNYSEGTTTHLMPCNDFVELVCDFLGAARAYCGEDFSYKKEYEWWCDDREKGNKGMHPLNKKMLDIIFSDLAQAEYLTNANISVRPATPEQLIKSKYIQQIYYAQIGGTLDGTTTK